MLSDDIGQGVSTVTGKAQKTFSDTMRGALLLGGIGLAIGIALWAAPLFFAFLGTAAVKGTFLYGIVHLPLFHTTAAQLAIAGAALGATIFGIGSLLPGGADMKSFGKKMFSHDAAEKSPEPDIIRGATPDLRRRHAESPDNPLYKPNLGADILAKNNAPSQQGIGPTR